jgi:hypothetical protein
VILGKFFDVERDTCTENYDGMCRPKELLEEAGITE